MHFEDYFIITGIPRSGTSLVCNLTNQIENVWCGNEIHYNLTTLPGWFREMKIRLLKGEPVPNRLDKMKNKTTNTMKDGQEIAWQREDGDYTNHCKVGSKINAPYMGYINTLVYNGYKILCIIRNPVYVIGSYQMPYTSTLNIVNCETDPRYKDFDYRGSTKIEKQAELWNYFAMLIQRVEKFVHVVRYEDLCDDFDNTIDGIGDFIGVNIVQDLPKPDNLNRADRYQYIAEIKEAVARYAPFRENFGYE